MSEQTVTYQGKTYTIDGDAYPTNRLFDGCYNQANHGNTYTDEWADYGRYIVNGRRVVVTWQWEMVKGCEPEEADQYPWDDSNIVSVKPID